MSDEIPALVIEQDFYQACGLNGLGGELRWRKPGLDKLVAAGIWRREFTKGSWGSPDAELKTQPPTVKAALAMLAERRTEYEAKVAAEAARERAAARARALQDERMRRPSLIPSASAPAETKPAATAYTADELAALVSRR